MIFEFDEASRKIPALGKKKDVEQIDFILYCGKKLLKCSIRINKKTEMETFLLHKNF